MMSLHFLLAKSNNTKRDQFECDVSWFRFCFDFAGSHARCDCYVVQIKQIDCKMSTKNMSNYK